MSSPLVARLLIDTMRQIFSQSGAAEAALIIETRPPRTNDFRGDPWQVWHDWRNAADQKAVIELLGEQRGRFRFPASKGCAAWPLSRCRFRRWQRRDDRAGPGVRRLGAATACYCSLRFRGQCYGPSKATGHRERRPSTTWDWQNLLRRGIGQDVSANARCQRVSDWMKINPAAGSLFVEKEQSKAGRSPRKPRGFDR